MKKIGISCGFLVRTLGLDRAFELCKESGFDSVDFSLERYKVGDAIYGGSDDAFESHFDAIKRKAADFELLISQTHGRCATYRLDDEAFCENIDRINELDIRATSVLGAPACVIHFPNTSRCGKVAPNIIHDLSATMYNKAAVFAEKYKTSIACETFGAARIPGARIRDLFSDPAEFKHQYGLINTEYKTICVDTGHTHEAESFWVPPPEEMIRILGKDVTILHLHDNNGHYDDHLLPGMGNINWPGVFDALDDIGYSGVYNFEVSLKFGKNILEDTVHYVGKLLRKFVDNRGN